MEEGTTREPEGFALRGCDVRLSTLGLGTWAWGDDRTWGMRTYDRSYSLDSMREALRVSVAAGVTLVDTAEVYGKGESERLLGTLLAEDPALRERVVVATKFFPAPQKLFVRAALLTSLRASLERLRLPWVHLYQLHGPVSLRGPEALADALAAAHGEGLTRAVGVSNYSEAEVRALHAALAKRGIPLATNQLEYSLLRTHPERVGLLRACRELGVVVLAYSPLGMGRLTGKYSASNPPPGGRNFANYPMEELEPVLRALRNLGARHGGKTPSQVALNWLLCKGVVPIPGAKSRSQAEQNAGALGWRLAPEEVAELDGLAKEGRRTLFLRLWQHG